jgi:hypothetical protein
MDRAHVSICQHCIANNKRPVPEGSGNPSYHRETQWGREMGQFLFFIGIQVFFGDPSRGSTA